jgi:hypothetical protein
MEFPFRLANEPSLAAPWWQILEPGDGRQIKEAGLYSRGYAEFGVASAYFKTALSGRNSIPEYPE